MTQFFFESSQKARKIHFCDYCCEYIEPGGQYRRVLWKPQAGVLHVMKEHIDPPCPPEDHLWISPEPLHIAEAIAFELRTVEVLVNYRDGSVGTEARLEMVPVTLSTPLARTSGLDIDMPF